MVKSAQALLEEFDAFYAYTESDEIFVLLPQDILGKWLGECDYLGRHETMKYLYLAAKRFPGPGNLRFTEI